MSTERIDMDAETLQALKASIEKWEKIAAGVEEDLGEDNCALCQRFLVKNGYCRGCPVMAVSDQPNCKNTPYDNWLRVGDIHLVADTPERVQAAQAELEFLKSLLPQHIEQTEKHGA